MRRPIPALIVAAMIVVILLCCTGFLFRRGGGSVVPVGALSLPVAFQNTSASTEAAGYMTFAEVFKDGDVQPSNTLVTVLGGTSYYTQTDVKATYTDGAVKHAVLTVDLPSIAANSSLSGTLQQCFSGCPSAPGSPAPTAAALAASSYNVTVSIPHYYIPTPTTPTQTTATTGGSIPASTTVYIQETCVNANGESLPSIQAGSFNSGNLFGITTGTATATNTITALAPVGCGASATGWKIYGGTATTTVALQTTSPDGACGATTGVIPIATATCVLGTVDTGGAAVPTTNTATLGTSDSTSCKTILQNAIASSATGANAIYAPAGSLTTSAGTWTWGASAAKGYTVLLNGTTTGSAGMELLAQGNNVYLADNTYQYQQVPNNWYEWNGSSFPSITGTPPALAVVQPVGYWLGANSGAAVNEFIAVGTVDSGLLKVECDISAYADGTTKTDVILDDGWAFNASAGAATYDISMTEGSNTYTADQVQQYLFSSWHHEMYSSSSMPDRDAGTPNIAYNIPYLIATGAVPPYDTSYGTSATYITDCYDSFTNPVPPLDAFPSNSNDCAPTTGMSATGGRADIAPVPNWTALWILSQGYQAYWTMVTDADMSGGVPWNDPEEYSGLPLSMFAYAGAPDGPQLANAALAANPSSPGITGNWWQLDRGHTPDLNYVPYMVTGSHYRLKLMELEADWEAMSANEYGSCTNAASEIYWYFNDWGCNAVNEVRATAWTQVKIAETSWIVPDADPAKTYFRAIDDQTLQAVKTNFVDEGYTSGAGQIEGYIPTNTNNTSMANFEDQLITLALSWTDALAPDTTLAANALAMINWKSNWDTGTWLQGNASGTTGAMPTLDGNSGYYVTVCTSAAPWPCTGYIATWTAFAAQNEHSGCPSNPLDCGMPSVPNTPPNELYSQNGPCESGNGATMGGYAQIANAALAWSIRQDPLPAAIEAWAFTKGRIYQAYQLAGNSQTCDYQQNPQFLIAPMLPDGTYLDYPQMQFSVSQASPTLTASGGDSLLDAIDSTGTVTLTGGTDPVDILLNDTDAPGTLTAGNGQDYLFNHGAGAVTFVDGAGSDYMAGLGFTAAAQTYQFGTNKSTANTVVNFRHGTDVLKIKANLNGAGITTAAGYYAAGATVGNSCVFTIGAETIATAAVPCSSLSASDITVF